MWSEAPSLTRARGGHVAVTVDGRLCVVGGVSGDPPPALALGGSGRRL